MLHISVWIGNALTLRIWQSADKAGTQRKCETEEQQDKSVENQEIDSK